MTAMTYSEVYEAIINRLKDFADLPLENIQVGNTDVDGGAAFGLNKETWAQMRVNYAPTIISGLADNPVTRRVGVLSFRLFGAKGYGEYPSLDLAEKLTTHFQFYRVSFLEFLTGDISPADIKEGEWYALDVSFTFRVYTNGAQ